MPPHDFVAPSTMRNIPNRLTDLSLPFLQETLFNRGCIDDSVVLCGFELNPISANLSRSSRIARIALQYTRPVESAPTSLVIKLQSEFEGSLERAWGRGAYEREANFYNEIAAQFEIGIPKCYFAFCDPDSRQFALLTEDVPHFWPESFRHWPTAQHSHLALETIAPLHAAWWAKPVQDQLPWVGTFITDEQEARLMETFPDLVDQTEREVPEILPPNLADVARKFVANRREILGRTVGRTTFIHRDFHAQNLLFDLDRDPLRIAVVDWSEICAGPSAHDVSEVLVPSLPTEERRAHERALVAEYHRNLERHGVSGYSFNDCWDDYRCMALEMLSFMIRVYTLLDVESEAGRELFRFTLKRTVDAVRDLKAAEFV